MDKTAGHLSLPTLDAYTGGELPTQLQHDTIAVVLVAGMPATLNLRQCGELAAFLACAAANARAANERARNLCDERVRNAPNCCKACGHLNDPTKRGWCLCEHCKLWVDMGPFPGESLADHMANAPIPQSHDDEMQTIKIGSVGSWEDAKMHVIQPSQSQPSADAALVEPSPDLAR